MTHCGKFDERLNATCGEQYYKELHKCNECVRRDHDAMIKDMIRLKGYVRDFICGNIDSDRFTKRVHQVSMRHVHGFK